MTKEIMLTQGEVTLVDDEDFKWLNQWKWCAQKSLHTSYACRTIYIRAKYSKKIPKRRTTKNVHIHRLIMRFPKGLQIDHIDGDGLNNQRTNLRICTSAQNHMNKRKISDMTSIYKGVSKSGTNKKWYATIGFEGKTIWLGGYETEQEASLIYDAKALELYGQFATLNFPKELK